MIKIEMENEHGMIEIKGSTSKILNELVNALVSIYKSLDSPIEKDWFVSVLKNFKELAEKVEEVEE